MISRTKCMVVSCNGCNHTYEEDSDFGITHFSSWKEIREEMELAGWIVKGRKIYCSNCVEKLDILGKYKDGGKDNM